ncbi:helix-turn-helix transcriptional regulator [Epibacterium ulvae]|uniref:helix-turn-helix transcriptional regulator n=1 Tax=Epibacterium ulvae TaxID=1156985 RepID=UPI00248FDF9C|nr:helix-turn-helix transcriptional regulator [Epibacterium ulvae]
MRAKSGPMPSLTDLAEIGGMSLSALRQLFLQAHQTSPMAYIRNLRLTMNYDNLNIQAAAVLSGYTSASNFATVFRKSFALTPSQVRQHKLRRFKSS